MPKLKVETAVFPINTPVRIVAAGGMSGDWYGAIALTGATTKKGGYSHTVIKALSPDTGELVQMPWRSDFLEQLGEGEELEKIEELRCAIFRSKFAASSVASPACAAEELQKQDSPINLQLPSSSNQKNTDAPSLPDTIQKHPATTTSEPLLQQKENSTSLLAESHAKDLAQLEEEKDFLTRTLTSGLKCFGLLMSPVHLLWSLKTWAGLLIEVFEQSLEDSEWQAIRGTIRKSYQHRKSERPTEESGSLLLPTPMAHSRASDEYRNPGQDKLEQKLRLLPTPTTWGMSGRARKNGKQGKNLETELKLLPTPVARDRIGKGYEGQLETELQLLIPKGHVSTPELREWMMGLPLGWTHITDSDGGQKMNLHSTFLPLLEVPQIDTPELPPLGTAVLPSKQRSPGEESHTSQASAVLGFPQEEQLAQDLSDDEERDRHRLETKVERAFYEAGSQTANSGIIKNIHTTEQESSDGEIQLLGVQQGIQDITPDREVLQPSVLQSLQQSQDRHISSYDALSSWNDPGGDREGDGNKSGDYIQDSSEQWSQNTCWGKQEGESRKQSQLERRNKNQQEPLHLAEMSGASESESSSRTLCSSTHISDGAASRQVSEELWIRRSKERSCTPRQRRQARQPNRKLRGNGRSSSSSTSPPRHDQGNIQTSSEDGHGRNLSKCDNSSEKHRQKSKHVSTSCPAENQVQGDLLGVCQPVIEFEELTEEEIADRHRLELGVERAFYTAGSNLREIRDRRLYRSTHKTFELYCKERFGFQRRHSYRLIEAAGVVDNLCPIGTQIDLSEMGTIGSQILPTSERQVRDLINLEPDEQKQIWQEAVEKAGGKVPTGAVVKGIVERIKERTFVPLTEKADYVVGDIVIVKASGNSTLRPVDGYWGVIAEITNHFYRVCISVRNEVFQCKGDELNPVELQQKDKDEAQSISDRILKLAMRDDLDPFDRAGLEVMQTRIYWTDRQKTALASIEQVYGITAPSATQSNLG